MFHGITASEKTVFIDKRQQIGLVGTLSFSIFGIIIVRKFIQIVLPSQARQVLNVRGTISHIPPATLVQVCCRSQGYTAEPCDGSNRNSLFPFHAMLRPFFQTYRSKSFFGN